MSDRRPPGFFNQWNCNEIGCRHLRTPCKSYVAHNESELHGLSGKLDVTQDDKGKWIFSVNIDVFPHEEFEDFNRAQRRAVQLGNLLVSAVKGDHRGSKAKEAEREEGKQAAPEPVAGRTRRQEEDEDEEDGWVRKAFRKAAGSPKAVPAPDRKPRVRVDEGPRDAGRPRQHRR
jgi:hypothetical protein